MKNEYDFGDGSSFISGLFLGAILTIAGFGWFILPMVKEKANEECVQQCTCPMTQPKEYVPSTMPQQSDAND